MLTQQIERTVTLLSKDEKIELIKKLADSLHDTSTKTEKRISLKGYFSNTGITDEDILEAKKIWR